MSGDDWLMEKTGYAIVDVYEYQHGKQYMNLFCQGESGDLYRLQGNYRVGSPKIVHDPVWSVDTIQLTYDESARLETPLASVVYYNTGPGVPTVHLFYIDTSDYIRDVVWTNGEEVAKSRLPVKVSSNSSLSVIYWRVKDDVHLRLFYQSPSGVIEEYSKEGNAPWTKGHSLDFSKRDIDGKPWPGTALSFINLKLDAPQIRGYWETQKNKIREFTYNGGNWELSDWVVDPVKPLTSISAISVGDRNNPDILIYHVDEDGRILQTNRGRSVTEIIADTTVDDDSRLAVDNNDAGMHIFASGGTSIVRRVAPKNSKGDFAGPNAISLEKDSPLKVGMKPPTKVWR